MATPLVVVKQLCDAIGIRPPLKGALHHGVDVDGDLFKYERHGEFYRISVTQSGKPTRGEAVAWLPDGWLAKLPGQRLVAIHTHILQKNAAPPSAAMLKKLFGDHEIACSSVHQGKSTVWSNFRIGADGFTRLLVKDGGVSPHRLGRLTRRLHEIETYRMMALLALPLARQLQPKLAALEFQLTSAIERMTESGGEGDSPMAPDQPTTRPTLRPPLSSAQNEREAATSAALASVAEALGRLRYGAIQLVVHDGRLVQIEVTERQRFA